MIRRWKTYNFWKKIQKECQATFKQMFLIWCVIDLNQGYVYERTSYYNLVALEQLMWDWNKRKTIPFPKGLLDEEV